MPHDNDSNKGPRRIGDIAPEWLEQLRERAERPLVKIAEVLPDGRVAVEFFERIEDDYRMLYDPVISDPLSALQWVAQVAPKSWITKEHIETFAVLMLAHFRDRGEVIRG